MKERLEEQRRRFFLGNRSKHDKFQDDLDYVYISTYRRLKRRRYLSRGPYRKNNFSKFREVLHGDRMTEQEFLFHYRVSREAFWEINDLIKNHREFRRGNKRKQAPSEYQLLVLLKFLGTSGNGSSDKSLADHFATGHGTVRKYRKRATLALLSFLDQAVTWIGS